MRLVATHLPTTHTSAFDFAEPGGTMGRCPGNHLLLAEDARIGRVQAVVRIRDGSWSLKNVSSRSEVILNGQAIPLLQEMPVAEGDTLTIGDYTLRADRSGAGAGAAAETTEPAPQAVSEAQHDTSDIFKELLDGPGVLPVGQSAETGKQHPFELDSQAPRNHPDPVQQLNSGEHRASSAYSDTAYGPLNTEPEHRDSHIFSDPTPSTLQLDDPLAPQRRHPIEETLAHGHASNADYEKR